MKRVVVILTTVLVFGAAVSYAKDLEFHGTLEFGSFSQYVGGTSGATFFNKPVFQQSFELNTKPLGLYVKVWNSVSPKGGWNSDFGDEIDYILGIRRSLGKGWDIDVGYAFYDLHKVGQIKGDLHAVYGWLGFPKVLDLVRPFLYMEQDIPTDKNILPGGLCYRLGVYATPEIWKRQPVYLELSVAGHDDAFGSTSEAISSTRFTVGIPLGIWKLVFTPKINFQKRLGRPIDEGGLTKDKIWGGLSLSYSF